jgi:RNase P subunit RPR2
VQLFYIVNSYGDNYLVAPRGKRASCLCGEAKSTARGSVKGGAVVLHELEAMARPTPTALREERQRFLWSSSQQHIEAPALSRVLLHALDRATVRDQTPLPPRALQRCCSKCLSLLAPGFNCHVTEKSHPHRPSARRRSMRVHCESCGHVTTFVMPAKPSSRIAEGHAPSAAPSKQKARKPEKAEKSVEQKASKRKRVTRPIVAPVPEPSGDTLFGFDFVPL